MRMEKTLVLYDRNTDYTKHFTDYVRNRSPLPFTVYSFSDFDTLLTFSRKRRIDILLSVPEETDHLKQIPAREFLYLTEQSGSSLHESRSIYRYQSGENILRELMQYLGSATDKNGFSAHGSTELITVFSPIGQSGKTRLALSLARELNKAHRTLYLSMEENSGLPALLNDQPLPDTGLSDLLYFYKQDKSSCGELLKKAVLHLHEINMLLPCRSPGDLELFSSHDLKALIESLLDGSGYDYLVLDTDSITSRFQEILPISKHLFLPVRTDPGSLAKLHHFESCLGNQYLPEGITRLVVPPVAESAEITSLPLLLDGSLQKLSHALIDNIVKE
jgi:hypothetical protein